MIFWGKTDVQNGLRYWMFGMKSSGETSKCLDRRLAWHRVLPLDYLSFSYTLNSHQGRCMSHIISMHRPSDSIQTVIVCLVAPRSKHSTFLVGAKQHNHSVIEAILSEFTFSSFLRPIIWGKLFCISNEVFFEVGMIVLLRNAIVFVCCLFCFLDRLAHFAHQATDENWLFRLTDSSLLL